MSAFMCDDLHLSALAAYAFEQHVVRHNSVEDVLKILWEANRDSLIARYSRDREKLLSESPPKLADTSKIYFAPVRVIKSAECYRYQACEHDGWEGSAADRISKDIIACACSKLPGYDEAPWGAP